ncbi:MAG: hypothetical protein A2W00_06405 [Candidatus Eisenbacteria bacterium RBG_16_71_46]|nr:MAG: hypothetical protein A2W00_06405 [Candidatus Eisenbacteria bacterium RBG_16_71_46]
MRVLLLAVCLLALAAPTAQAGGINIAWGTRCWFDNPTALSTFACDSNDGTVSFTVSFNPADDMDFRYLDAWIHFQSDSAELPDWWQLTDPGGCREGSLSVSADTSATWHGCPNPWKGMPITHKFVKWSTSAFPYFDPVAANRAKLRVSYAMAPPGVRIRRVYEYYGFTVTINFARTVGAEACRGCSTPVTIVLNSVLTSGLRPLTTPLYNQCLRWQAGGVTPCSATPTRSSTWGKLKSLYR